MQPIFALIIPNFFTDGEGSPTLGPLVTRVRFRAPKICRKCENIKNFEKNLNHAVKMIFRVFSKNPRSLKIWSREGILLPLVVQWFVHTYLMTHCVVFNFRLLIQFISKLIITSKIYSYILIVLCCFHARLLKK